MPLKGANGSICTQIYDVITFHGGILTQACACSRIPGVSLCVKQAE